MSATSSSDILAAQNQHDQEFQPEYQLGHVDFATAEQLGRQLNWLTALAVPHIMAFLFPPMFVYFWDRCTTLASGSRGFPKLGLGIPRGFAKTMFLKLLCLYIILFTRRKFILVICAKEDLAASIVSDVIDALSHQNIRRVFGNWDTDVVTNRQDTKIFNFRGRTVILKGVGQGTSFRGIAEKYARPDVMIFDDAQTKDSAMSAGQAKEFATWFRGTALKAKDNKFCFFLYVGNMYPKVVIEEANADHPAIYGCMLKNLKLSSEWETVIVGAILADGQSLWEDLQSLEQLLTEYRDDVRAGQAEVFLTEVMNDDEAIDFNLFDPTKVPNHPYLASTEAQGSFLVIDPSLGKTTSDDQMVGKFRVIDGRIVLEEVRKMQVSAPRLVDACIDWCLLDGIPAIAVESYAYQATLGSWFEEKLEELGVEGISVILITLGRASKNTRIKSMLKQVMDGDLLVSPQARPYLFSEVRAWQPLKRNNKDNTLDVACYGQPVAQGYPVEIQNPIWGQLLSDSEGEIIDAGLSHG